MAGSLLAYDCSHMQKNRTSSPHISFEPSNASQAWLTELASTTRQLAKGTALFRQGDKAFGIFRVLSGRVRLVRLTPSGTQVPMHTAVTGELFAEASIFSTCYHCDAIAMQDCEVLVYQKAELTSRLKENDEMLWAFTAEMAQRVQMLRTRLEIRHIRSAPERVLQFLKLQCDASGIWSQHGTLKQLAEEVGLTHEALYRALAMLERNGSIKRERHALRLLRS